MTDHAIRAGGRTRLLARLGEFAIGLALVALIMLALAPLGWRAGWWHYSTSFSYFLVWGGYVAAAAGVVALLAVVAGLMIGRPRTVVLGLVGLLVGIGVAYVPWHFDRLRTALPRINDITTDTASPPTFEKILPLRAAAKASAAAYDEKFAAEQKKAYADIAPVTTALAPADAFARALDTAKAAGFDIVASDPATGRIEASQSSLWFGFTDDVVIRVAARADGPGSRVDVRSVSRAGRHDFGANAARVRAYTARLKAQPGFQS